MGVDRRDCRLEELGIIRSSVARDRILMITGAAGMGKTWLCERAASMLEAEGALVLSGCCPRPWGVPMSYAPFVTAWRDAQGFAEYLEGAARMRDDPPEVALAWLCDRVLAQVAGWAEQRPVVLFVEDAHWIDPASMMLLHALVTSRATYRLLVVVTARAGEAPAALHELASRPGGRRIELGPLTDDDIRRIVGPSGLDDAAVESVVRRAGGHPLHASELARHRGDGLSDGLRVLLGQRVRELGDIGVQLLAAAAVGGAHEHVLPDVLDLGREDFDELVRLAVRLGLVALEPLRPKYPLLGEAAADLLSAGPKQLLHKRFALALEDPLAAAWHWERAGDARRALDCWVSGARQAAKRHAHAEAADAYARALALRDGAPEALGSAAPDRVRLVMAAAEAARWAGRPNEAAALLRDGLLRVPAENVAARCEILCMLWDCRYLTGNRAAAIETLAEATALAAGLPDSPLTARLATAEAGGLMTQGRYAEGAVQARRAVLNASLVPDQATEAHALSILGVCLAFLGQADEAVATLGRARDLAHRLGSVRELVRAAGNLTFVLANIGRRAQAVTVGREALSRLDGLGLAGSLGGPLSFNVAVSLLALGRWDELEAMARRVGDCLPQGKAARLLLCRAEIEALRGRTDAAHALLEESGGVIEGPDELFDAERAIPEAVAARVTGRYRAAVGICRTALTRASRAVAPIERWRLCAEGMGALADLQTAGGRVSRFADPEAVRQELMGLVEIPVEMPQGPEESALALVCRAEFARAMGVQDGGSIWREAALVWEAMEMVYHAGYARMREAEARVAVRDVASAADPLRRALVAAESIGAQPLRAAVERVAKQGRLPLPAAPSAAGEPAPEPARLSVLTGREREVLDLVGLGRTNREIAAALFLSERTVGVHVSRILAKLGAANRAEAGSIARASAPTKHT
ncbi:MAG TPA: AAA family ATPase [Candidatus Limnocylindrales bacterium]|nr:AAA family ATPase [Candidatus Limnocylindrales bacterium]